MESSKQKCDSRKNFDKFFSLLIIKSILYIFYDVSIKVVFLYLKYYAKKDVYIMIIVEKEKI